MSTLEAQWRSLVAYRCCQYPELKQFSLCLLSQQMPFSVRQMLPYDDINLELVYLGQQITVPALVVRTKTPDAQSLQPLIELAQLVRRICAVRYIVLVGKENWLCYFKDHRWQVEKLKPKPPEC